MPKKAHRFTTPERRHVLKAARRVHKQPELVVRWNKRDLSTSRLPGRLLVITPRKIGTAPQRNLLRRRLKAIFHEEHLDQYGFDVIIHCHKGSVDLSFKELHNILKTIFAAHL